MSRKNIHAYWWSPIRSLRNLYPEVTENPLLWARLGVRTGRPFVNFGDELAKHVLEYATGAKVSWSAPGKADIISIGSIMQLFLKRPGHAVVWGTGVRVPDPRTASRVREIGEARFLAVRGPRSKADLGLAVGLPIGDPGLIASSLIEKSRLRRTKGNSFIPHFRAWNSQGGRAEISEMRKAGFRILPPTMRPLTMIREIAQSDYVVSSSLHGVIVAHSVGTPTQLVGVGQNDTEPSFKFLDYFESIGVPYMKASVEQVLSNGAGLREQRQEEVGQAQASAERLSAGLIQALDDSPIT